jgi:hypothetical protein
VLVGELKRRERGFERSHDPVHVLLDGHAGGFFRRAFDVDAVFVRAGQEEDFAAALPFDSAPRCRQ